MQLVVLNVSWTRILLSFFFFFLLNNITDQIIHRNLVFCWQLHFNYLNKYPCVFGINNALFRSRGEFNDCNLLSFFFNFYCDIYLFYFFSTFFLKFLFLLYFTLQYCIGLQLTFKWFWKKCTHILYCLHVRLCVCVQLLAKLKYL